MSWLFLWDAGAFVYIELYLRKAHTQKPLVMLGEAFSNKITGGHVWHGSREPEGCASWLLGIGEFASPATLKDD